MTEDGTGGARPVLEGDPPPPCGQHPHARAFTGEDGRKWWCCTVCGHPLRPFHPQPMWEDLDMSKLPLTEEQIHGIAEAVMEQLMPRVEEALNHAYDEGRRAGLKKAEDLVREMVRGGGNVQTALGAHTQVRP